MAMSEWVSVILIGVGATAVMDVWSWFQRALGLATLDYALVGRWAGHLFQGRFAHAAIGKAAPVPGELPLGWLIHYLVGIMFAVLLVAMWGRGWLLKPDLLQAIAVGLATVVFPFFLMQPAMGAGIAASRTLAPWSNRLRSLLTHGVFGAGLYLSARVESALGCVWDGLKAGSI